MNTKLKNYIIELANNSTDEICGFIYTTEDDVKIFPCKNTAINPKDSMQISTEEHLECIKLGKIIGVYHSHPDGPDGFSEEDLSTSEESTIPFYLYDVLNKSWLEYIPSTYSIELEGRPFYWGFDDCYGAARNYYRKKLGLHLKDYDRDETFGPSKSNAILDNFANEGFIKFNPKDTQVQLHDALLFDISKNCTQHIGIFTSNQKMFHHPLNVLSRIEPLDGRYLSRLSHILRHKTLI